MAADTLYFLRNARPFVPGASVTSKPWSRSHASASSYVRASIAFDIFSASNRSLDAVCPQVVGYLFSAASDLQSVSSKDTILHSVFRSFLHITIVTRKWFKYG